MSHVCDTPPWSKILCVADKCWVPIVEIIIFVLQGLVCIWVSWIHARIFLGFTQRLAFWTPPCSRIGSRFLAWSARRFVQGFVCISWLLLASGYEFWFDTVFGFSYGCFDGSRKDTHKGLGNLPRMMKGRELTIPLVISGGSRIWCDLVV